MTRLVARSTRIIWDDQQPEVVAQPVARSNRIVWDDEPIHAEDPQTQPYRKMEVPEGGSARWMSHRTAAQESGAPEEELSKLSDREGAWYTATPDQTRQWRLAEKQKNQMHQKSRET